MGGDAQAQRALKDRDALARAMSAEHLPPAGVAWIVVVGCAMALWSFVLVALPPPAEDPRARMLWVVNSDMFAIQNLGHGAFLIMFATSWWRNRNILGLCMCQLSAGFLVFVALGYNMLALHLYDHVTIFHHVVPGLFMLALLAALITCARMSDEFNLNIFRPKLYLIKDHDTALRRALLAQALFQCAEPVVVALARLLEATNHEAGMTSTDGNPFIEHLREYPALTLRAFIESYTLGFHQAFVMATIYSQVVLDDGLKDPDKVLLAVFGQLALVLSFGVGGFTIPADPLFFAGICAKVAIHGLIALLSLRLYQRLAAERPGYQAIRVTAPEEEPDKPATSEDPAGAGALMKDSADPPSDAAVAGAPRAGAGFQGVAVWDIAFSGETAGRRMLGLVVLIAAIWHGLCWQLQSILSVWLAYGQASMMDRANGMRNGLNFGMHGAGITVYILVLALRSPVSFPFLKLAALIGAFGGAAISLVQLGHLSTLDASAEDGELVTTFFYFRAFVGVLLGITYAMLSYPDLSELDRIQRSKRKAQGKVKPSDPRRALFLMFLFWVAILVYAVSVTRTLGRAGVHAGFALNAATASPESTVTREPMVDRWHHHRLVEFPPGYGLVFHFAFLLPGFVIHYFAHEFEPSKWIGIVFTGSAALIMAAQAFFAYEDPTVFGPDEELSQVLASAIPAVAGFVLMISLFTFVPGGGKKTEFLAGDFWH